MKIQEFKNNGVGASLLQIYVNKGYIVINNDNASFVSNEFAIRLFLSVIEDRPEFAKRISEDVSLWFSKFFLGMLISLYEGNLEKAKEHLKELKKRAIFPDYKDEVFMYDFILNNNNDDFLLPYEENEYLRSIVKLAKKYLKLRQFKLAADILKPVLEVEDSSTLKILLKVLENIKSDTKYMVDDNYHVSDTVTYEGYAAIERKLVVAYEMGNYIEFRNIAAQLGSIMHDDTFANNVIKLFELLNRLRKDDTLVLRHAISVTQGNFDDALSKSIDKRELYDIYEKIEHEYNRTFDIKLHMYKLILDDIMDANKRNLHNVVVNGIYFEEAGNVLEKYMELVSKGWKTRSLKFLENNAECLANYDYLVKEINTEAANISVSAKINDICDYADSTNNPYVIIDSYKTALLLQKERNPIFYIKIASAYEEIGNYAEALHVLEDAERIYAYPDTYLKMMELFIKCKRFDKVLEYHKKYETYYPMVSGYDYYLVSIACMNKGNYKEALDYLDKAEKINQEVNGVLYCFDYERSILTSLINGEEVMPYTSDDFVSFEIDEVDEGIINEIDTYLRKNNSDTRKFIIANLAKLSNARDSMMYLLNIVKILILSPEDNRESVDFVQEMIEKYNTSDPIKKYVLEKIGVYKSAVKL